MAEQSHPLAPVGAPQSVRPGAGGNGPHAPVPRGALASPGHGAQVPGSAAPSHLPMAQPGRPAGADRGSPAVGGLEKELSRVEGSKWVRRLGAVLVLALVVGIVLVWRARTRPPPPSRYVTAQVTRGDVFETVQSTGQVKPTTEVQVGAQVSGRITKVYVDFNSRVKAGDVLAELDPTLFGAQLDSTRAQLAAGSAAVKRAEVNLMTAKQRVERARKLVAEGIGSQADLDTAQGAYDVAVADVAAAKAQVAQVGAQMKSSRTNLDYTRIHSPIDGIVINRAIDPGQTVAASFQAPTLFVIAQDLRKMRVLADIDEADVAVIEVDNEHLKLRPGMTATVVIRSAEAPNAMRVPNAALRFKPSPPTDKDGNKLPQDPLPALAPKTGRIWVVTDATLGAEKSEPRVVDIGVTDGIFTAITTDLGDAKLVTDETDTGPAGGKGRAPRLF